MTVAVFGRTELRCSVFVLLLFPLAVIFDELDTLLIAASSLIAHETAHGIMAHRLGFRASSIEIRPFGCIARLERSPNTPSEAAAIAAAGPAVSLFLALSSAGLAFFSLGGGVQDAGFFALSEFSFFNLTLGAMNLLPVLPLDGGRLALSLAASAAFGKRRRAAALILCLSGVLTGIISASLGVYALIDKGSGLDAVRAASLVITGAFVALSAAAEKRELTGERLRAELKLRSRLASGRGVRVFGIAMNEKSTVRDALMAAGGSCYGMVFVVDDDMHTLAVLDEGALMNEALRGKSGARLGEVMQRGSWGNG